MSVHHKCWGEWCNDEESCSCKCVACELGRKAQAEERGYQRGLAERDAEVARLRGVIRTAQQHWNDGKGFDLGAVLTSALAATGAKPSPAPTLTFTPVYGCPAPPGTSPRAEPIYCECGDILETASQYETHRKISHPYEDSPRAEPDDLERFVRYWLGPSIRSGQLGEADLQSCLGSLRERETLAADAASAETVRAVCEWLREWPRKRDYERKGISVAVYNDEAHCIADDISAGAWKKGGRET